MDLAERPNTWEDTVAAFEPIKETNEVGQVTQRHRQDKSSKQRNDVSESPVRSPLSFAAVLASGFLSRLRYEQRALFLVLLANCGDRARHRFLLLLVTHFLPASRQLITDGADGFADHPWGYELQMHARETHPIDNSSLPSALWSLGILVAFFGLGLTICQRFMLSQKLLKI
jgi:hypothetical protein